MVGGGYVGSGSDCSTIIISDNVNETLYKDNIIIERLELYMCCVNT